MTLQGFLIGLAEHGSVRVGPPGSISDRERLDAKQLLQKWDRNARLEMAATAPPFCSETALWAAILMYRACQFLVFRHVDARSINVALRSSCPRPVDPSTIHAADLTLRYLPDLMALARGKSKKDPLLRSLERLAKKWPLSSVGVADLETWDPPDRILGHPALRVSYVDRILRHGDIARLADPETRNAVRDALGAHTELHPEIAEALKTT